MKNWEYSRLTKAASKHGGPKQYITDCLVEGYKLGYKEGAKSKNPYIALAFGAGVAVAAVVGGITYCVVTSEEEYDEDTEVA